MLQNFLAEIFSNTNSHIPISQLCYTIFMATTIVTKTSWFSRIGSSFRNIFLGFLLVAVAIILLFWNEGRAVKTAQSLKEGASSVISVKIDKLNPQNEGKLVHFTGEARTPSILSDNEFGLSGSYLKLKRNVEVYQWIEESQSKTVEKLGGGTETTTTYTYKKDWDDTIIDSSSFQEAQTHQNPTSKKFDNAEWVAENVSIGAFNIPTDMINSLSSYESVSPTPEMLATLPYDIQEKLELVSSTIYYNTLDSTTPEIGDTRVTFEGISPQILSVIAAQKGKSLTPFKTSNGRSLSFIQTGEASAQEMFKNAVEGNNMMTWIVRLLGLMLLFAGFRSILGLLPILAAVVPFVGKLVGMGMSLISGILTLTVGLTTIAIAWIFYRPLIGILLLAIAGAIFFVGIKLRKKK